MAFDPNTYICKGQSIYEDIIFPMTFFEPPVREKVLNWQGDPEDILVASYPKTGKCSVDYIYKSKPNTGTTWTSLLLSHILNDADPEKVQKQGNILLQMEYVERAYPGQTPSVDVLASQPPPRLYKTHLPYRLLQHAVEDTKVKVILVMRNPKDTLVSFYHFYKMCDIFGKFTGTFHEFFELFKAQRVCFGDIFEWFAGWWKCRELGNVLIVKYEDLTADPVKVTGRIADFVGKSLTEEQLKKIVASCAFQEMGKTSTTNLDWIDVFDQSISRFFRKGKVGDWKNHMTSEESKVIDDKCQQLLDPIGLSFVYE